jgi:phage-related minor tail protein
MENNFLATDVNKLGVNTPTAQEQFKRGSDRVKQLMPNGIIPNAGIQGQVLNAIAQSSLQETAQAQDVVMGALNIQSAVGVQVDQLLAPFGMPRRLATSTIVELTITASENTVISATTQILNIDTQILNKQMVVLFI